MLVMKHREITYGDDGVPHIEEISVVSFKDVVKLLREISVRVEGQHMEITDILQRTESPKTDGKTGVMAEDGK